MYGIVNKAIQDLVTANFGEDKWEAVKQRSGIDLDFFISSEPYDDQITYKLAVAASEVLEIPLSQVLYAFGEWWVLNTSKTHYGGLMDAGGKTMDEFLTNLPLFHNRIMLIYPKLTPPEFRVQRLSEYSIEVHYFSKREGLHDFVLGLLNGIAKMYNVAANVEMTASRGEGADHEIYLVSW